MSYSSLGATIYDVIPVDVRPIIAPEAPKLTDSLAGSVLAMVLAVAPAVVIGGVAGATMASYNDKQVKWGAYGAVIAGGVAAFALALNAARPAK